ncbi:hypothetical protein [Candidatus Nitrospira inopinata]|uniref:Uncharacterized protein n=1 Tax=Candidatus Nitrospira inopinata TaxID=1715989 RepID=A0A0S4KMI0_9BACT|nr:hypothetical protein [Candidatus Nitrospira inopinata]CUQ65660.1 protein of unknown function [Candidatus Nitrospira inopinata]
MPEPAQDLEVLQARLLAVEKELEKLRLELACSRSGNSWTHNSKVVPIGYLRPSQAIIASLREFDRPVGVGVLRQRLESKGYPMEKFGPTKNYFYTLICRLAESGKIARLEGDEVMLAG